jgi:PAS domain S-box-containing protein
MHHREPIAASQVMSPVRLVLRLAALIFLAEVLIMIFGPLILDGGPIDWSSAFRLAVLDSVLLILISGAAIYHWVVKPYVAARDDAEHALRESEERFRQVAENVSEVFWMTDPAKQEMLYVSPAYEKVWGRSCQSLYDDSLSFVDAIHREDRDAVVANFERQAAGTYDAEYRVVQPDGSIRHIRDRAFPVCDAAGEVYRIVGIAEDVSAQWQSDEALRNSEERVRSIIENSPDSIVLKDREGRFQLVNRNFLNRYGITEAEILGKTEYDLHAKEIADNYEVQHRRVVETGVILREDIDVPFADGRVHTLVVTRFPIFDKECQVLGVGGISVDVTEQRRAEQDLREAQKMEAVGRLTGGVAHDFNNLLAVILGNAELVEERLGADDRPTQAILRTAMRGAELTQRLLAFSRRQPLHSRPVNLNELIDGMIDLLGRTLGETIEIETNLAQDIWPTVADSGQVENALLNLAINARDAMPGGGKLRIETVNAALDADQAGRQMEMKPGNYVVLSVEDTGTGIEAEDLRHVFEPFFTTKDVGEGSGLGLSMVYGFTRQSRGTTVRLYLPRGNAAADSALQADDALDPPQARGETVLVVEDDAEVRAIAEAMLKGLGYEVLTAEDAKAGLAALERVPNVSLMLSDVALPGGVSGLDMVDAVRRSRPDLKVLFMSGHGSGVVSHGHRFRRSRELLMKPFRRHELAQKVRDVLDDAGS